MSGLHDMGGEPAGPVDPHVREPEDWERIADAVNAALVEKGILTEAEIDGRAAEIQRRWEGA